jgi:hypothetical protein
VRGDLLLVLFPESPFHFYQIFYRQAVCSHLPTIQGGCALRTAPDSKIFSMTERDFREIPLGGISYGTQS